jgi:hypothetical protein
MKHTNNNNIYNYMLELSKKNIYICNLLELLLQKYNFNIDYDYCKYDKRYIKLSNFYNGTIFINSYFIEKNNECNIIDYKYLFNSYIIKYYGSKYNNAK